MKKTFFIFLSLILVSSCLPVSNASDEVIIKKYVVGERNFYIPDVYTDFKHTSIGNKSGFIQMWYPGDFPVPGAPKELYEQGTWHQKNIRLLFTHAPKAVPEKSLSGTFEHNRADKLIGEEYGLKHYSQSDDYQNSFRRDIWVDDEKKASRIECSKKQTDNDPVQLCHNRLIYNDFSLKITYEKTLLPEWKTIQDNVLSLYESFASPETSKSHLSNLKEKEE